MNFLHVVLTFAIWASAQTLFLGAGLHASGSLASRGSLLLGVYNKERKLISVGSVGTGWHSPPPTRSPSW